MSIEHHPDESLLTGYAAGTLDLGRHIAVATHLAACADCQKAVSLFTEVGGALFADLSPAPMGEGAFVALSAKLDTIAPPRASIAAPPSLPVAGLPAFVRRYNAGKWRMVAPGLSMRPIHLPVPSAARVFLLKSAPGAKLRHHTHAGTELTCVIEGGFSHDGGHFGPGDFDFGDSGINHQPTVDPGADCLCLVAMEGHLRLTGWLGALLTPLVRL
ncbi:putative transcriptional regulator [Rhizomicrobium palustre]|jgi:putative transcriptional regulator|uniref:Putative transcriptional regulator n=1 Tax=Rhizomicrobium palustre TaxID=189966 RepID=A0A846MYS6_9PROT|nr:ChrR family anti-sigma-E factor [Rhizomicrobium palustre]NIK88399.1 putative transcriptional regulator [Rhizomicrobium palustre]